jgi:hypothetical protein
MEMFSNLKKMEEKKEKEAIHFSTPPVGKPEEQTKKSESQKINNVIYQKVNKMTF